MSNLRALIPDHDLRPAWLTSELFPFQSRFVDVDGARVHYVDEGSGPVLLFLHGAPNWSFFYRQFISGLRHDFRCVDVDRATAQIIVNDAHFVPYDVDGNMFMGLVRDRSKSNSTTPARTSSRLAAPLVLRVGNAERCGAGEPRGAVLTEDIDFRDREARVPDELHCRTGEVASAEEPLLYRVKALLPAAHRLVRR
jgi:hypothetical protein